MTHCLVEARHLAAKIIRWRDQTSSSSRGAWLSKGSADSTVPPNKTFLGFGFRWALCLVPNPTPSETKKYCRPFCPSSQIFQLVGWLVLLTLLMLKIKNHQDRDCCNSAQGTTNSQSKRQEMCGKPSSQTTSHPSTLNSANQRHDTKNCGVESEVLMNHKDLESWQSQSVSHQFGNSMWFSEFFWVPLIGDTT